jgi:hypothetical protein
MASIVYGLIYGLCVLAEISYDFDHLGMPGIWVACSASAWVSMTSISSLMVDWKCIQREKPAGLATAISVFLVAIGLLLGALLAFLPDTPITQIDIAAQTARGAYLKDSVYSVLLGLILFVVPFHLVLTLQREFQEGRYRPNLALLSGERKAVAPDGAIYLRPATLAILLLIAFLASIPLTMGLFSHLRPGRYSGLFTVLIYLRWIAYFGMGLLCVLWYGNVLNRLKREALTAEDVRF